MMNKQQLTLPCIQYFRAPASTVNSREAVSIAMLFQYITGERYHRETELLRTLTDEKERKSFKAKHFDFVTFSGTFSYRKDSCLIQHSNLLCLDLDHVGPQLEELKLQLPADPLLETELLFTSPSGDGLKWVVEIDLSRCSHRQWFTAIRHYVRATYAIEVDEKCINESRSCFLPKDLTAYVNPLICAF